MASLNLSLTAELRAFIEANCGEGTVYSTPSEFVRDVLREKKSRMEAAELRFGIVQGYQDVIAGRTKEFKGDLNSLLEDRNTNKANLARKV